MMKTYNNLHNITSKKQHVQQQGVQFDGILKAGYDLTYNYADNPFQISTLKDENYRTEGDADKDKITSEHKYEYDANGNLIYVNTAREKQDGTNAAGSGEKKLVWDEENRLQSVYTNGFISGYWYDASGERVVKTSGDYEGVYVNDVFSGARTSTDNFTAYINPYMVVSKGGSYTKHIYIGSQRIVSKLGDLDSYGQDPRRIEYAGANVDGANVDYKTKYKASQQAIKDNYATFEVPYYGTDNDNYVDGKGFCCNDVSQLRSGAIGNGNDNPEVFQYYYHSDHLGSSSLITNLDGDVVQHVEYVPFGEVFIEERNNTWNTPYLFNAKELDEETGLYYYGARYYDPRISIFISADPMQEKYPFISTYAYTFQNPIKFIDPTGMGVESGGTKDCNDENGESYDFSSIPFIGSYLQQFRDFFTIDIDMSSSESIEMTFQELDEKEKVVDTVTELVPDYLGVGVSGDLVVGGGFGIDLNLGLMKEDGLFVNAAFRSGSGFDISFSLNGTIAKYTGKDIPAAIGMSGVSAYENIGIGAVSVGAFQDVARNKQTNRSIFGYKLAGSNGWREYRLKNVYFRECRDILYF
jgi:RHS repeat-associated protein